MDLDKLKNLPPGIIEQMKARRAQSEVRIAGLNQEVVNLFKLTDSILVGGRTPGGHLDPNAEIFAIGKFQNGTGDTVYLKRGAKDAWSSLDQIAASSAQVKTEEAGFKALIQQHKLKPDKKEVHNLEHIYQTRH